MATYLVTGAAGFIASRVAEILLGDGHTIIGVDDLNEAYDVRLKHWRLERLKRHSGFRFQNVDIRSQGPLKPLFEGSVDGVVNLAARAGVRQSVENPWIYVETNIMGTLNLLTLCAEKGIKKFVLASTSSLYGARNSMPYREDADTNRPLSPYAASKKGAEALCHAYHHLYGLDITIPRYFTVYGPGGRPDMSLFRFVQWISEGRPVLVYGDGTQSRDFTFVDDIARGTIDCLGLSGYNIINLGSDKPVVLSDAIRLIEELTGKSAILEHKPMHPADVMATWADIGLARRLLGWEPKTSFRSGVEALVSWYKENRGWAKDIRTS